MFLSETQRDVHYPTLNVVCQCLLCPTPEVPSNQAMEAVLGKLEPEERPVWALTEKMNLIKKSCKLHEFLYH